MQLNPGPTVFLFLGQARDLADSAASQGCRLLFFHLLPTPQQKMDLVLHLLLVAQSV